MAFDVMYAEQIALFQERKRLRERFPALSMEVTDKDECTIALSSYERLLSNKDICEGDCAPGENCPTGGRFCDTIFVSFLSFCAFV